MSLFTTFSSYNLQQLIVILESKEDYTPKAKEAALAVVKSQTITTEELKYEAFKFWEQKLDSNIKELLLSKQIPSSTILSEEEIREIFKKAFDNWKENQKTFEVDTTKYWFV